MKPENTTLQTKRHPNLTDAERNSCLKLLNCGLSTDEIIDIMHISRSTINNIRQAHAACLSRDWSVLQKLSTESRATVDWAMSITGVDKDFLETFGTPKNNEVVCEPVVENAPTAIQLKMYDTLIDIRNLLADIYNRLI